MEQTQDYNVLIEQMNTPAFLVHDGVITAVNRRAAQYMAEAGTPVASILASGQEEYGKLENGSIYLNIKLCGVTHSCTVTQLNGQQLFIMEDNTFSPELQVLALAAQQLSVPVSEISLLLEQLTNISDGQKAKINQNLNKLQRMLGNMSDAGQMINQKPRMLTYELCAIFEEVLCKAKALLSQNCFVLEYQLPSQPVYSLAEPEMLKRAIYNLISNAAKFTQQGGLIQASLKQTGNRLYFSITNGNTKASAANVFHRYTRQPGLEDPRFGLGLGMTLVHAAAVNHGGTVLAEQTEDQGLKVTMTIAVQKSKQTNVRSPILIPDLYGGRDQALIELSDILSYQLYMD